MSAYPNPLEALTAAIEAADGLPVPTSHELAERIERGLENRGYRIARKPSGRVINGYPCTCDTGGCLEHPFEPRRGR
jgi:hypothetical protein